MSLPDVVTELYLNGSWVDVSDDVHVPAGMTVRRGRGDQYGASVPGELTFTLRNPDGDYTPGNTSGAHTPYIERFVPCRVTVNTTRVFTGRVVSWQVSVDSARQSWSTVRCEDILGVLDAATLGPFGIEELHYRFSGGGAIYPLAQNKAAGGTGTVLAPWRDTSTGAATIVWPASSLGAMEFVSEAPPFLGGSMQIKPTDLTSGPILSVPVTLDPGTGGTIGGAFKSTAATDQYLYQSFRTSGGSGYIRVYWASGPGLLRASVNSDAGTLATADVGVAFDVDDNAWHVWSLHISGDGKTIQLACDGNSGTATTVGSALTISATNRVNYFGGFRSGTTHTFGLVGHQAALFTTTDVTAAGNNLAYTNAVMNGYAGEPIEDRMDRLMYFIYPTGTPAISNLSTDSTDVMGQNTDGKSLLAALNELMDVERGAVFADNFANLYAIGILARSVGTPYVSFDCVDDLDNATLTITDDASQFANQVVATGPAGSVWVEDGTSVADIGPRMDSWSTIAEDLTTAATDRLAVRFASRPHIKQVTVDLLTSPSGFEFEVLTTYPLTVVELTSIPAPLRRAGASAEDLIVEGTTLNINESTFAVTFDLVPTG